MHRTLRLLFPALLVSCHAKAPRSDDLEPTSARAAPLDESSPTRSETALHDPVSDPNGKAPLAHPLPWCAVDRRPLPEDLVVVVQDGRTFCTCSTQCADALRADPVRFAAEVDRAAVELQTLDYPLDRCVVSGRPLGESAISALAGPVLVRLCCDGCREAFDADPRSYLSRIATARSAAYCEVPLHPEQWTAEERDRWLELQREELTTTTCAACGVQPTDNFEARELLLRGTLVRVCSRSCAERARSLENDLVAAAQRAAFDRQKRDYPMSTCAVSGQDLGPHAESAMLGLLFVRTSGPASTRKLETTREAIVTALRTARVKARQRADEPCCSGSSCPCSQGR